MTATLCALKRAALIKHLGRDEGTIHDICTHVIAFGNDGEEYLVLTEDEADERAAEYIKESLWAFDTRFICNLMPCTKEFSVKEFDAFIEIIKCAQVKMCEGCNSMLRSLVGHNLERLINKAISADGRGHFLSTYDSEEHEYAINGIVEYYIYRVN
jgi:hypothetical protein